MDLRSIWLQVQQLDMQHQHNDKSWHSLRPVEHGEGPADSERSWQNGRVFRCVSCEEQVRVKPPEELPGRP